MKFVSTLLKVRIYLLVVFGSAVLHACGGSADVESKSAALSGTDESQVAQSQDAQLTSRADDSTASDSGVRVQALAISVANSCASEAGSTCQTASPVLDTSKSLWKFSSTGAGTLGQVDQARGLVSANSLALNYQFRCMSTPTAECARVAATYSPASSILTAKALSLSLKGPLNADVRASICDDTGRCFEYDVRRTAAASSDSWAQVVVDLSSPRNAAGTAGGLGGTAKSISFISVAPVSGSSSGWLEIDAIQFVNPVAAVAFAAVAAASPAASPIVVRADGPVIFNATDTARPGDVVTVQGARFGSTVIATLEDASGSNMQVLNIISKVGTTGFTAQIPASASGALLMRVNNGTSSSALVRLNGAVVHNLDTTQLTPGGAFRVFGRNLMRPGSTPVVRVAGAIATINIGASDENMLVVTAPSTLTSSAAAVVTVDNGNGTGAVTLDRTIAVVSGRTGDVFGLQVGWAAGFGELSTRVISVASDSRLSAKAVCNGSQDDTAAIQQAIDLAASSAGGLVQLPAGVCRITNGLSLRSNVVLQGLGKDSTTVKYEGNYPVVAVNIDLAGVRNLSLINAGSVQEGPLLKQSTRLFLQNIRINTKTSRHMYFTDNTNMVVAGTEFIQEGTLNEQGPYLFDGTAGLVFVGNATTWVNGANSFARVHDSYIAKNVFSRDASYQNQSGVVHSMTIDFAHRVAVVGNTFNVKGGPITNQNRNDGETILTEGGGAQRTENLGTVQRTTTNTLTDMNNSLNIDPFSTGSIPENYGIAIVSGNGAGQHRRVVAYSGGTATIDRPWDILPDAGSNYATFVWGLEKAILKGNLLSQNPRGIWLYQTALRDVAVVDNVITEGGGIYLRANQKLNSKMLTPMYNIRVAGNSVKNSNRNWPSYINAVFVNTDAKAFGTAMTGIDVRDNQLQANLPNLSLPSEEYAGSEGYMNMTRFEDYSTYEVGVSPRILASVFQRNVCTNCDVAFRVGTGDAGLVLWNNQLVNSKTSVEDSSSGRSSEPSVGTVVR